MRIVRSGLSVAVSALVASCAMVTIAPYQTDTDIPARPDEVALAAEEVFSHFDIPVEEADPLAGVVESGTFEVNGIWGGEAVVSRVDCGLNRHGDAVARLANVRLDIRLEARKSPRKNSTWMVDNGRRPGAIREWSTVRLDVRAEARLGGDGEGEKENRRCTLTKGFHTRLLRTIRARAERMAV